MSTGDIVAVVGAVVDVPFPPSSDPERVYDALKINDQPSGSLEVAAASG